MSTVTGSPSQKEELCLLNVTSCPGGVNVKVSVILPLIDVTDHKVWFTIRQALQVAMQRRNSCSMQACVCLVAREFFQDSDLLSRSKL